MLKPNPVKVGKLVFIGQRSPSDRFVPAPVAVKGVTPRNHYHAQAGVYCGICLRYV